MVISEVYEDPFFQTYELLSHATNEIVILPVHFLHYDFVDLRREDGPREYVQIYARFVYVFPCVYTYVHAHAHKAHT